MVQLSLDGKLNKIGARLVFRFTGVLYLVLGLASLGGAVYALATQRTTPGPALAVVAILTAPCVIAFVLLARAPDKVHLSLRWLVLLLGTHLGLVFLFNWRFGIVLSVPLALVLFGAFRYDQRGNPANSQGNHC